MGEIFELTQEQIETFVENNRPKYIYFENWNENDDYYTAFYGSPVKTQYQTFVCTVCGHEWSEEGHIQQHKKEKSCPSCGNNNYAFNRRFGRRSQKEHMNCVVVYIENKDSVWAECLRIDLEDYTDIWNPSVFIDRRTLYHFSPGGGQRYKRQYTYKTGKDTWVPMKSRAGYAFYTGLGTIATRVERADFYIIGEMSDTFLGRFSIDNYPDDSSGQGTLAYMMACCEAPVFCEFCLKAKLWTLLDSRLFKNYSVSKKVKYKARNIEELFPTLDKPRRKAAINYLLENRQSDPYATDKVISFLEENTPDYFRYMASIFGEHFLTAQEIMNKTKVGPIKLANYIKKQLVSYKLYSDYLEECSTLGYDLTDSAVLYPKDLRRKHTETSALCRYKTDDKEINKSRKRAEKLRKNGAEYSRGRLMIVVPNDTVEIIIEGAQQSHCVGGYVTKHSEGKTTILFIRKKSDPFTPYCTLEMDMANRIVRQWYGQANKQSYRDNLEVNQLLEHYIRHLEYKSKKGIKTA